MHRVYCIYNFSNSVVIADPSQSDFKISRFHESKSTVSVFGLGTQSWKDDMTRRIDNQLGLEFATALLLLITMVTCVTCSFQVQDLEVNGHVIIGFTVHPDLTLTDFQLFSQSQ